MSKCVDMLGQKYGRLTVIERYPEKTHKGQAQWLCSCACGATTVIPGSDLRRSTRVSCGCIKKEVIDLVGQQFSHLTVISRAESPGPGRTTWLCVCACGNSCKVSSHNLRGRLTKSCGCIQRKAARASGENKLINLIGKTFCWLTIIEAAGTGTGQRTMWWVRCKCGNLKTVSGKNLKNGAVKSCGCRKHDKSSVCIIIGKKFGMLTVSDKASTSPTGATSWLCVCDCGAQTIVDSRKLRHGRQQSCGFPTCNQWKNTANEEGTYHA